MTKNEIITRHMHFICLRKGSNSNDENNDLRTYRTSGEKNSYQPFVKMKSPLWTTLLQQDHQLETQNNENGISAWPPWFDPFECFQY
jgi:hypothetical protein